MKYERYTIRKLEDGTPYIFDKLIFTLSILALLIIFFIIVIINGGLDTEKHFYVKCQSDYGNPTCQNPMYLNYPYCTQVWENACLEKSVPNGFIYGTPQPRYFIYFNYAIFILLVGAFISNHLIHNRHIKIKNIKTGLDK